MQPDERRGDLRSWLESTEPVLELGQQASLGELVAVLQDQGFDARVVDLEPCTGKAELFEALHGILDLGEWFGFNWDALEEALYGPDEAASEGRVLVCSGYRKFQAQAPKDAEIFIDILRTVASIPDSGLRGGILLP